jgi:phenylalanyl-tRNA synthetase beta chain
VRLFEIGRNYRWKNGATEETPILTLGATGLAREKGVAESEREYGFADLKGDLERIGELSGGFTWQSASTSWAHPARNAVFSGGEDSASGVAGELARRVADQFKLRQPVFLAEMELPLYYAAVDAARAARRYRPISKFPAVDRDFSLLLKDGTSFGAVRDAIRALQIPQLVSSEARDLFRGKNVPAGHFSLLVSVTFQSHETTLTEAQVNDASARIIATLTERLGATLRSA